MLIPPKEQKPRGRAVQINLQESRRKSITDCEARIKPKKNGDRGQSQILHSLLEYARLSAQYWKWWSSEHFMSDLSVVTINPIMAGVPALSLRQKAVDVPADTPAHVLRKVIADMTSCLYASNGVGLAAPQVGIGWRLFLAVNRPPDGTPTVLINPRFVEMSDELVLGREACLSIPGYLSTKVPRSKIVKIEGLNQFLEPTFVEASDFFARVLQHEYDHLDGILYIDRLKSPDDLEAYTLETRVNKAVGELFTAPNVDTPTL
jgi:peptide deformylase